jgi:hypothetical protein
MNRIMVLKGGSPAIHKLGDIGRKQDDYIRISSETDEYYIGNFEEGFGYIDVKFKKYDCRLLTEQERKELNGKWYSINGNPLYRIYVDEKGNVIKGTIQMSKGKLINIVDITTRETKYPDWLEKDFTYAESEIEIGRPLFMFLEDGGYFKTTRVEKVDIKDDIVELTTRNSIYYLKKLS